MRNFPPILYFNLKTIPWIVWMFAFLILGLAFDLGWGDREYSSVETQLTGFQIYYAMMIGMFFYSEGKAGGGMDSFTPIPHGEFLLTRSVPRKTAWRMRANLCFLFMLAAPFLAFCLCLLHPDMHIYLSQSASQQAEVAQKTALYQASFPASIVIHQDHHDTLVIPAGNLLVAGLQLLVAAIVAWGLQILLLFVPSKKMKQGIFFGCMIPFILLPVWKSAGIETLFFQFVRHWVTVVFGAIAIIGFAWWFAHKRAGKIEIL